MYGKAVLQAVPDYEALGDAYLNDLAAFSASEGSFGTTGNPIADIYARMISWALDIQPQIPSEYLDELDGFASALSGGFQDVFGDGKLSANEYLLLNLVPDIAADPFSGINRAYFAISCQLLDIS